MSAKNCNQCEKVFTTSSSLSHHKRTHNKLNIVTCEFCGFQFSSKNLTRHKESCKKIVFDSEKLLLNVIHVGWSHKPMKHHKNHF